MPSLSERVVELEDRLRAFEQQSERRPQPQTGQNAKQRFARLEGRVEEVARSIIPPPTEEEFARSVRLASPVQVNEERIRQVGTQTHESWYVGGQKGAAPLLTTTPVLTADRLYVLPLLSGAGRLMDAIRIRVTANVASAEARLGLYASKATGTEANHYPERLVRDFGTVNASSTAVLTINAHIAHRPDVLYWLAVVGSVGPRLARLQLTNAWPIHGVDASFTATPVVGFFVAHSSTGFTPDALPTMFPTGATDLVADPLPAIAVRFIGPYLFGEGGGGGGGLGVGGVT